MSSPSAHADYIRNLVNSAPPLTDAQRDVLSAIFRSARIEREVQR